MLGSVQTPIGCLPTLLMYSHSECGSLASERLSAFRIRVRVGGKEVVMHAKAMNAAVDGVAHSDSIATLLRLAAEIAQGNVALLAQVGNEGWSVCGVHVPNAGGADADCRLSVGRPLRVVLGSGGVPISLTLFDQVSGGRVSSVTCRIATPVILAGGRCFGALCALDPACPDHGDERIESKFVCLATVIASQIDQLLLRDLEKTAFLDQRSAGQLREQFIAILGHDLRNPLQAIFATSDLLERRLDQPAHAQMAARIKTNARRMSLLIDDVLDFARARLGGGIGVDLTEVENLGHALTTVVQELQDGQTDCEIISNFAVTRPVRCDLGRLQQVASNLLGNALAHGRPHSPIKINARTDEDSLVLEVWNSGEPIPAESLSKIFEPFWRHSVSASRNGLGLGLHICSQIVRAHHGSISVTSTLEAGTQFTARLPLSALLPTPSIMALAAATSRSGAGMSVPA
jgi:signal transduction histidine kinase